MGVAVRVQPFSVSAAVPRTRPTIGEPSRRTVAARVTAVTFDQATSCGWTRGAVQGDDSASTPNFTAFSFTANAHGCYVQDTDLSKNAATTKIALPSGGSDTRLVGNYDSNQNSGASLGISVNGTLTGTTLTVFNSNVKVTSGGTLSMIAGAAKGDLLVLTANPALTVNETGNIRLTTTPLSLTVSPSDTLTLLFDGTNWLEVAYSHNA